MLETQGNQALGLQEGQVGSEKHTQKRENKKPVLRNCYAESEKIVELFSLPQFWRFLPLKSDGLLPH